jgi:hypothetical protein
MGFGMEEKESIPKFSFLYSSHETRSFPFFIPDHKHGTTHTHNRGDNVTIGVRPIYLHDRQEPEARKREQYRSNI